MIDEPEDYDVLIGLDLGQLKDYTAITVIYRYFRRRPAEYDCVHLERMRSIPYPEQVQRVVEIVGSPKLAGRRKTLIVDRTGVGVPVVDMVRVSAIRSMAKVVGILIHGGNAVSEDDNGYGVPKRDLVGVLQVLFQSQRFRVASRIPDSELLVRELLNFKVKISISAHDSYEALREGDHDDLVLSAAIACWWGEQNPHGTMESKAVGPRASVGKLAIDDQVGFGVVQGRFGQGLSNTNIKQW